MGLGVVQMMAKVLKHAVNAVALGVPASRDTRTSMCIVPAA